MKSSLKTSILNDLASLDLFFKCFIWTKKQRSKYRFSTIILLCPFIHLLSSSLTTKTIAAPTNQINQVIAQAIINRPTLKLGSQGQPVSELQAALKLLGFYTGGVDGVYNEMTAKAVAQFQQAAGLNPNGIVDATTWQRLFPSEDSVASNTIAPSSANNFPVPTQTVNTPKVGASPSEPRPARTPQQPASNQSSKKPARTPQQPASNQSPKKPTRQQPSSTRTQTTRTQATTRPQPFIQPTPLSERVAGIQYTGDGYPILRIGMSGSDVTKLQQRLKKLGFLKGNADGDFGELTEAAVIGFQQSYGLEADGVVGGATWEVLLQKR